MPRPTKFAELTLLLLVYSVVTFEAAGLQVNPSTSSLYKSHVEWGQVLALVHTAAAAAMEALQEEQPETACSIIASALGEMPQEGRWAWCAEGSMVAVCLMDSEEPLLSLVQHKDLVVFATAGNGCFAIDNNGEERACMTGDASMHANVLHVPDADFCPQLTECVQHLREFGLGMPLELAHPRGHSSCEGLHEVVVSGADFHLSPPTVFLPQQLTPPVEALCAYQLLLDESGGSLTDAYGEPLDLVGALVSSVEGSQITATELVRNGILAGPEVMVPYFLRAIKTAFPSRELDGSITVSFGMLDGLASRAAGAGDFEVIMLEDEDGTEGGAGEDPYTQA